MHVQVLSIICWSELNFAFLLCSLKSTQQIYVAMYVHSYIVSSLVILYSKLNVSLPEIRMYVKVLFDFYFRFSS